MEEIELFLPWPPSVNNYYSHARYGVYVNKKGKAYRSSVADTVAEQICRLSLDFPLNLEVVLHPPDKRRRDLDNYMKSLLDALTAAGVWEDDSLIDQLGVYRGRVVKSGSVVIRINEAGPILPHPLEGSRL